MRPAYGERRRLVGAIAAVRRDQPGGRMVMRARLCRAGSI
jgi:hypothetical protein